MGPEDNNSKESTGKDKKASGDEKKTVLKGCVSPNPSIADQWRSYFVNGKGEKILITTSAKSEEEAKRLHFEYQEKENNKGKKNETSK